MAVTALKPNKKLPPGMEGGPKNRVSTETLLAAGKPHEVLPLSGVTHMTPQEVVAENLLLHQLEFLQRNLC